MLFDLKVLNFCVAYSYVIIDLKLKTIKQKFDGETRKKE